MTEPVPLRPDEQVAGGFLHVTLGGQAFELKVLPMGENRKWTAHLATEIRDKLQRLEPLGSADAVADLLAQQAETMMDLLIAYDVGKVLPEREWIDTHATDRECYEAMKRVTAAAYPFGPDLLRIVPELIPMIVDSLSRGMAAATVAMASSRSTSGSRPNTAGRPTSSKPTSPTSSSRSTPRRQPKGASKRPLPS
jgi:hypothetical protein